MFDVAEWNSFDIKLERSFKTNLTTSDSNLFVRLAVAFLINAFQLHFFLEVVLNRETNKR